ncbi:setd1a protein [Moniliophthora roreri]|nr:setd1a protein [Moniliophthora roreri]
MISLLVGVAVILVPSLGRITMAAGPIRSRDGRGATTKRLYHVYGVKDEVGARNVSFVDKKVTQAKRKAIIQG